METLKLRISGDDFIVKKIFDNINNDNNGNLSLFEPVLFQEFKF